MALSLGWELGAEEVGFEDFEYEIGWELGAEEGLSLGWELGAEEGAFEDFEFEALRALPRAFPWYVAEVTSATSSSDSLSCTSAPSVNPSPSVSGLKGFVPMASSITSLRPSPSASVIVGVKSFLLD